MSAGKKIVVTVVSMAVVAGAAFAGYKLWKKNVGPEVEGTVFVQKVSEINSAMGVSLSGMRLKGVVEAQKTEDIKYDSSKQVESIEVKVGDEVKAGDVLFTYDVEAMQLELDGAKIELERLEYDVETKKKELEEMEKLKQKASRDEQVSLEADILSLKSDIATAEYEVKTKKSSNKKLKNSIKNASVVSPTDGTVKEVADLNNFETMNENIIVKISKDDNYVVKGTVNEMTIMNIYTDMPVIISSRVSDDTWHGVITEIDTNPQSNNDDMYGFYYDGSDSSNQSSKYSFTVEPESLDGLMLGQHIVIEPDLGMDLEVKDKQGIWLYSDYIFEEDGKSYVWAKNDRDRIEKREVTIGDVDEEWGDCEILSGLDLDDSIAYPMGQIEEGMSVTTNIDEMDIPDMDPGEFGGDEFYDEGMYDDGMFDEGMYDEGMPEDVWIEDGMYDDGAEGGDFDFEDADIGFEDGDMPEEDISPEE